MKRLARALALILLGSTAAVSDSQPVGVLESAGAPLKLSAAHLVLDANATSVVEFTATVAGDNPVTAFHARVYVLRANGRPRGFHMKNTRYPPGERTAALHERCARGMAPRTRRPCDPGRDQGGDCGWALDGAPDHADGTRLDLFKSPIDPYRRSLCLGSARELRPSTSAP
jgi:hypothetical protein